MSDAINQIRLIGKKKASLEFKSLNAMCYPKALGLRLCFCIRISIKKATIFGRPKSRLGVIVNAMTSMCTNLNSISLLKPRAKKLPA